MPTRLSTPAGIQNETRDTTAVSVKGKWVKAPAFDVNGTTILIRGRWIRQATVQSEEWLESELENPEACVGRLKEQKARRLRADIFTFTQKIPATIPKYTYAMEWESVAVARITGFQEWWEDLPQESRKNVRRSQKRGVVVKLEEFNDDLVRKIVDVNNDSPVRQGRRFTHYRKTFDQVKLDHSSFADRSDFVCAYFNDELIGFLKIVYRGETASIMQLLSKAIHYDKRPSNALVAKAIELCHAKGINYVTYGKFNYGNERDRSIRDFKTRHGFQEVLLPRFYVPLTHWGRVCIKLKFHRGLKRFLPRSVIVLGVSARAKWYDLRAFISRCSSMPERSIRNRQTGCSNPPAGSSLNARMLPSEGERESAARASNLN